MYKIIKLNEENITQFKGKILQVLDKGKRSVVDCLDFDTRKIPTYMWVITCLVEVE